MPVYADRDAILATMGFVDYEAYLAADLWKSIRARVLDRDDRKCRLCEADTNVVHHHDYDAETLHGATLERMFSLCPCCHESIEFDGERKRSLAEVQGVFAARIGMELPKKKKKSAIPDVVVGPVNARADRYERLLKSLKKPERPAIQVNMQAVASGSFHARSTTATGVLAARVNRIRNK